MDILGTITKLALESGFGQFFLYIRKIAFIARDLKRSEDAL